MKIITICGSARFEKEMKAIAWQLEYAEGNCVIQLVYNETGAELTPEGKARLDEAHRKKIELCDAVYIVDINGYIGESVKSEIAFAESLNKEIIYHSRVN